MTIVKRLYLLLAVVLIAIMSLIGVSISQIHKVFEITNYTNENTVPSMLDLGVIKSATAQNRLLSWQFLAANDPNKKAELKKKIDEVEATVIKAFEKYEKEDITDDKDRSLLQQSHNLIPIAIKVKTVISVDRVEKGETFLLSQ